MKKAGRLCRRPALPLKQRVAYFLAAFLAGLAAGFSAALAALRAAAFGSTAALKPAPGVNFGSLAAAILILSPVLGFTPVRAARACCLKEPKPGMETTPPFLTVVTTASSRVSTMRPASALVSVCLVARCSISSVLFIQGLISIKPDHLGRALFSPKPGTIPMGTGETPSAAKQKRHNWRPPDRQARRRRRADRQECVHSAHKNGKHCV